MTPTDSIRGETMTEFVETCEIRWSQYDNYPERDDATNGRPDDHPGHLAAVVGPYTGGFNVVFHQESWLKPYFTRSWETREEARAFAVRVLLRSLGSREPFVRESLGEMLRAYGRETGR